MLDHHLLDRLDTISESEAAKRLNVRPVTMRDWRRKGMGPPFYRCGRLVRYLPSEVAEWLANRRYGSTAQEYSSRTNR